jgi:hypothetical protein
MTELEQKAAEYRAAIAHHENTERLCKLAEEELGRANDNERAAQEIRVLARRAVVEAAAKETP